MEIVNVNEIFNIVLSIYLLIGIMIYLRPTFRYIHLVRLINKKDFQKYLKTVDKYIKKAKSDRERSFLMFGKIDAMIRFREWNGIEEVINSVNLIFSKYYITVFCNTILNLYILNRIEEGRVLVSKIQKQIEQQNEIVRDNIGIRLCIAINDYFNNDFVKSQKELQELLNEELKLNKVNNFFKSCIANTYLYLGLITKQENEIIKCKNYFENAIAVFYPEQCALISKVIGEINDISKE